MTRHGERTLLVHGGGIEAAQDGWVLGRNSSARAELAVELFHAGGLDTIVFAGGNGYGHELPTSEARLMADMAVRHDVPHYRIELEDSSHSTIGNWANALSIMQQMGTERVAGVTGQWASVRASYIGKQIIGNFGLEVELLGYYPSREREGVMGFAREQVSMVLARRCLDSARTDGVPLDQLDGYYATRKARTGLTRLKRLL